MTISPIRTTAVFPIQLPSPANHPPTFAPSTHDSPTLATAESARTHSLPLANTFAVRFRQVERSPAAYKHLALGVAKAYPDVYQEATKWANEEIKRLTGKTVDSRTIYLNRFQSSQSNPSTQTGWEHLAEEPSRAQTLPAALLSNFPEHDWDPGTLDLQAGLYTQGPGQSEHGGYGAHNEFPLAPSVLMHATWKTLAKARCCRWWLTARSGRAQRPQSRRCDRVWLPHHGLCRRK